MARVYNFSAGPSMLPEEVLKTAQAELLEYGSSGQSVLEMSHRSPVFDAIFQETKAALEKADLILFGHVQHPAHGGLGQIGRAHV